MKRKVHLTRLNQNREIVEEMEEEFQILGEETYKHPRNKKGMIPMKTSLGKYIHIGTRDGDYRRWYITDSLNEELLKIPEDDNTKTSGKD
ncbi:hypothetical protein GCM10023115_44210 [Pontixanthobacter gangjinensis]|uniref:Uncharacterized protein n=1 Tax=Christiangramia aestuarii TaxID=1028746 RepID=A0A7M3SY05_9FLAO|nr:hypothetical protein [Christiangramia aestuarii]MUP41486.1 hypothetical protein [Christiangramia aestuarii]